MITNISKLQKMVDSQCVDADAPFSNDAWPVCRWVVYMTVTESSTDSPAIPTHRPLTNAPPAIPPATPTQRPSTTDPVVVTDCVHWMHVSPFHYTTLHNNVLFILQVGLFNKVIMGKTRVKKITYPCPVCDKSCGGGNHPLHRMRHGWWVGGRVVVSVSTSRSRDIPTSRLGLILRKIVNVSVSGGRRLSLGHLRLVPKTTLTVSWWACRWRRMQCERL